MVEDEEEIAPAGRRRRVEVLQAGWRIIGSLLGGSGQKLLMMLGITCRMAVGWHTQQRTLLDRSGGKRPRRGLPRADRCTCENVSGGGTLELVAMLESSRSYTQSSVETMAGHNEGDQVDISRDEE